MLRTTTFFLAALAVGCSAGPSTQQEPPNILFISVDDLNDWIEPLGGHPQAKTPNLVRFSQQAVSFTRNYTASPACNPSRTALLTGLHTFHSGLYSNYQVWREVLPHAVTLPKHLSQNGYWSAGAGKIFHNSMPDPASWDDYFPSLQKHMPDYKSPKPGETVNMPKFHNMYGAFDWAPIDLPVEETGDYQSVSWVIDKLQQDHEKPFFLAAGIYRPHLPWYVPQKYFEMFPLDSIQLPKRLETDLDDLGERAKEVVTRGGNYHDHVVEAGQWERAVQGYLASITFADALVGRLLDALEASPYADNTIVVLWSDHGWQLGEKRHWRKYALWDNVGRTVLMIKVPEGAPGLPEGSLPGGRSNRVTSLMDIYPTLLDLAGLRPKADLDGRSLAPLLRDPSAPWDHVAITTYDFSEFAVRTEDCSYIRYIDDSEELYNFESDPEEWHNVADDPRYEEIRRDLASRIPENPHPLVDTSFKLQPHHLPPYKSKAEYEAKRTQIQGGAE